MVDGTFLILKRMRRIFGNFKESVDGYFYCYTIADAWRGRIELRGVDGSKYHSIDTYFEYH